MSERRPVAVVTGASSGLGAEFARQVAARGGRDLVLVARRADALSALAAELTVRHGVAAEAFPADLSRPADVERLCDRLSGADVDLLVNNAGFGVRGRFDEASPERLAAMAEVHVTAVVRLTRAVVPGMVARRRGGVVTVSSVAGLVPLPRSVAYSSTKAFQVVFSETLAAQLAPSGVRVQALCPGYTVTGFHDTEEYADFDRASLPRWLWLPAERVVRESLEALERGRPTVCVPSLRYRLVAAVGRSGLAKWFGRG